MAVAPGSWKGLCELWRRRRLTAGTAPKAVDGMAVQTRVAISAKTVAAMTVLLVPVPQIALAALAQIALAALEAEAQKTRGLWTGT